VVEGWFHHEPGVLGGMAGGRSVVVESVGPRLASSGAFGRARFVASTAHPELVKTQHLFFVNKCVSYGEQDFLA
jgi:hypothetical protein